MTGKNPPDPKRKQSPSEEHPGAVPVQNGLASQGETGREAGCGASAAPSPERSGAVADEISQLRQELAAAQEARSRAEAELAAATDAKLRALAELENFRQRTVRQMEEERRYALFPLIRDMLPVLDNLRRAIQSGEQTQDMAGLLAGVKLVAQQFQEVLQRYHCVEIEALGAPFDPHLHEAVLQVATSEHPAGTVVQVTQPGFRLHDRVVRPSLVVVAAAPVASETSPGGRDDHQATSEGKASGRSGPSSSDGSQATPTAQPPPQPG